jgi:hypothetical protein
LRRVVGSAGGIITTIYSWDCSINTSAIRFTLPFHPSSLSQFCQYSRVVALDKSYNIKLTWGLVHDSPVGGGIGSAAYSLKTKTGSVDRVGRMPVYFV